MEGTTSEIKNLLNPDIQTPGKVYRLQDKSQEQQRTHQTMINPDALPEDHTD